MSVGEACCACLSVEFAPVRTLDGLNQERWRCILCGAEFVRAQPRQVRRGQVWEERGGVEWVVVRVRSGSADVFNPETLDHAIWDCAWTLAHPEIRTLVEVSRGH